MNEMFSKENEELKNKLSSLKLEEEKLLQNFEDYKSQNSKVVSENKE